MLVAIIAKARNGSLMKWRTENKLNQIDAAEACGVTLNFFRRIETLDFSKMPKLDIEFGHGQLSLGYWREAVLKIAEHTDIPVDQLLPSDIPAEDFGKQRVMLSERDWSQLPGSKQQLLCQEHDLDNADLANRIDKVLKTLTYREREIIKLRYDLGGDYTHTLEEVGRIFKTTRERVRQIEAKAICKLRHPLQANQLVGEPP